VTVGEIRENPDTRAMVRNAIAEVVAVGMAKGIDMSEDDIDATMVRVDSAPAGGRASMAVDMERGNPMELPWLSGLVVSMGQGLNVPTPVHGFIATVLKFHQDGREVDV
jgi:2-dehydropantoate 2-reductase